MSEENKTIVGQWLNEYWNKGNEAIVDELGTADVVLSYPLTDERRGRESVKEAIREFRTAFPDASFSGEGDMIAEGDKVVARFRGRGTQKGDFRGIPATGKSAMSGTSVFRVADWQGGGGTRRRGCLEYIPTTRSGSVAGRWVAGELTSPGLRQQRC